MELARVHASFVEDWSGGGLRVVTGRSMYRPHSWSPPNVTGDWGLGVVRGGAYRRRASGIEQIVDTNTGFFLRPGEEIQVAHFTGRPEEITFLDVEPEADDCLAELVTATGPLRITPQMDLAHRRLLRAVRHGGDNLTVESTAFDLLTAGLAQRRRAVRTHTRMTTASDRRRLVNDACEILHTADRHVGLVALARAVGYSPFHLCRVFREVTGLTISQYRMRLRVHEVLDRLDSGEDDLSTIAASVGFADHSHMTRTVVAMLGSAPSDLRQQLRIDR